MIIDAKDNILGRLAAFAAKKALEGNDINIINSEQVVVTGKKERVFADYKQKRDRGTFKGPFLDRRPNMFVKRAIRGMLPYKKSRGEEAFKRIRCFVGVPEEFQGKKSEEIKKANTSKLDNLNYVTVKDICRYLGGKQ